MHKPPTAKDIPPVTLSNIPIVDASEFKTYISQVGSLYEQLQRVKETGEESNPSSHHRPRSRHNDDDEAHLRRPSGRPSSSRKTSLSSMTGLDTPTTGRRRSSSAYGGGRRPTQGPAPLSTIPSVYFEEDFRLENPRTFDVVSERSEVVRPPPGAADDKSTGNGGSLPPRKTLATNAILQEKLSWYMDTVEIHLISSISTASTTFFSALGSLKDLHTEAADSVEKIRMLRKELEVLDAEIATIGLDIVQKRRRRENLQKLNDAVLQLKMIIEGVAACESLVGSGDIGAALDGIDSVELLIMGERDSSVRTPEKGNLVHIRDLSSATALKGVTADLDTLRLRIGKQYEQRFVDVLLQDIRRHVDSVSTQDILLRWSSASIRARGGHSREPSAFPTYAKNTACLRKELVSVIAGLHRSRHLSTTAAVFRDAVLREVRNMVRKPLPSSNDDDNESMMSMSTTEAGRKLSQQEKSSILARNLRALDPMDAEALLTKIYIGVAETLRRLTTQVKVLLDVTSSASDGTDRNLAKSPIKSPPPCSPVRSPVSDHMSPESAAMEMLAEIQRALDMSTLLGQAVDVAQDKIVKVLKVRSSQNSGLPLVWFLRYFNLNLHFANECEAISGRGGTVLKNIVNGHIKEFVTRHGDSEKQALAQGMESDVWNAKDFSEQDVEILKQVLEAMERDASAWTETSKIWIPYSEEDEEGCQDINGIPTPASKEKTRTAAINGESFVLPNSAILCLHGINRFLNLSSAIPAMTHDISASLMSYLQLFNSRCTQLILGAGATKSAGLKNITTKHLALASQSVHFIGMLVPYMREFARRHLNPISATSTEAALLMSEFDKMRRTYQEHQHSIEGKIVDIMAARANVHSKNLREIRWDDGEGPAQSPYVETLSRETGKLHRVLSKHLAEHVVRGIMERVFEKYKESLGTAFAVVEAKTEGGKKRLVLLERACFRFSLLVF